MKQGKSRWAAWTMALCLLMGSGSGVSAKEQNSGAPPKVTFFPADQATGVEENSLLTVQFSKRMRLRSKKEITAKSVETFVRLADEANRNVPFTAVWDSSRNLVTLDPQGNLKGNTRYTITLLVKKLIDDQGNLNTQMTSSFTTRMPVDVIAPQAVILPAHGAKQVRLQTKVTLQFAEEVTFPDGSPLNSKAAGSLVQITDEKGMVMSTYCTWNKSKRTLTVKPRGKWQPNTTYRAVLPPGRVKDTAGNVNLAQSVQFLTGSR